MQKVNETAMPTEKRIFFPLPQNIKSMIPEGLMISDLVGQNPVTLKAWFPLCKPLNLLEEDALELPSHIARSGVQVTSWRNLKGVICSKIQVTSLVPVGQEEQSFRLLTELCDVEGLTDLIEKSQDLWRAIDSLYKRNPVAASNLIQIIKTRIFTRPSSINKEKLIDEAIEGPSVKAEKRLRKSIEVSS